MSKILLLYKRCHFYREGIHRFFRWFCNIRWNFWNHLSLVQCKELRCINTSCMRNDSHGINTALWAAPMPKRYARFDHHTIIWNHAKTETTMYRSVLSNWEFFIKMRAACLLSPSFITQGRIGARKAALILIKTLILIGHYST